MQFHPQNIISNGIDYYLARPKNQIITRSIRGKCNARKLISRKRIGKVGSQLRIGIIKPIRVLNQPIQGDDHENHLVECTGG